MKKKISYNKGYMGSYSTKTNQRIFEEFINTILLKYCSDSNKIICSLGSYDDVLVDQIKFKELYLVDIKFGTCHHKSNTNIHYFEDTVKNIMTHEDFQNRMDVVLMTTIVEHLDEKLLNYIFTHMKNILTNNGLFIFTVPNACSMNRLVGVQLGMLKYPTELDKGDKLVGHKKMYCYRDMPYFLRWLRMKKIEDIGIMFKPLSNSQMDKYFGENLETFIQIGRDLGPKVCSYIGGVYQN
ncbi:hypothetical protein LCGC14_1265790 [marine sediment metagenome]|uniref:Methyltransferase type 11 domain-containing protein n=1 Tax=marine sediment metagenome TaxID=412755 RepID=A0A0F9NG94_9ZZZZ